MSREGNPDLRVLVNRLRAIREEARTPKRDFNLDWQLGRLLDQLERLAQSSDRGAAPTPETPSHWQPIETVPDGTDFIIAAWVRDGHREVGEAFSDGRSWIGAVLNEHVSPKHWMPLPAPPLAGAVSHPQPEKRS